MTITTERSLMNSIHGRFSSQVFCCTTPQFPDAGNPAQWPSAQPERGLGRVLQALITAAFASWSRMASEDVMEPARQASCASPTPAVRFRIPPHPRMCPRTLHLSDTARRVAWLQPHPGRSATRTAAVVRATMPGGDLSALRAAGPCWPQARSVVSRCRPVIEASCLRSQPWAGPGVTGRTVTDACSRRGGTGSMHHEAPKLRSLWPHSRPRTPPEGCGDFGK